MRFTIAATFAWLCPLLASCASALERSDAPTSQAQAPVHRPPRYAVPPTPSPPPRSETTAVAGGWAVSRPPATPDNPATRVGVPPPPQTAAPQPQTSAQPATAYGHSAPPRYSPAPTLARPTADGPRSLAQLDPTVYRLAPGDVVQVTVFGEEGLSVTVPVEASGSINYPLLGLLPAGGLTVRELEGRIAGGLRAGYLVNPSVRVAIAQYRPIYVTGRVLKVGRFAYTVGLTVERAIATAGGITEFGSSRKIYIQRENAPDGDRQKASLGDPVFPGDTIVVEERLF